MRTFKELRDCLCFCIYIIDPQHWWIIKMVLTEFKLEFSEIHGFHWLKNINISIGSEHVFIKLGLKQLETMYFWRSPGTNALTSNHQRTHLNFSKPSIFHWFWLCFYKTRPKTIRKPCISDIQGPTHSPPNDQRTHLQTTILRPQIWTLRGRKLAHV